MLLIKHRFLCPSSYSPLFCWGENVALSGFLSIYNALIECESKQSMPLSAFGTFAALPIEREEQMPTGRKNCDQAVKVLKSQFCFFKKKSSFLLSHVACHCVSFLQKQSSLLPDSACSWLHSHVS